MDADDAAEGRDRVLSALVAAAEARGAIAALWLQGSLARGDADAWSDIDAYVAVRDGELDAVFAAREALLGGLGRLLLWSDAAIPGVRAAHGLYDGGVRLDLFFEPLSQVGEQPRQPYRVLVDKAGVTARLQGGWAPPRPAIAQAIARIVRVTRQGAVWPLRILGRGAWPTFAMMELDLINGQVAQLMGVQRDPALFYQHPFGLPARLPAEQQAVLAELTRAALDAIAVRDLGRARDAHLRVYDTLVREGRAACAALGVDYPIPPGADAQLRALLENDWPA